MRTQRLALPLLAWASLVLTASVTASAGEYNPVLSIGDTAPAWKNLPGVDGKKHSLADLKDKQAIVLVFTCNSCPYAVDYEARIMAFAKKHAGPKSQVALVAINVNKVEEDLLPAMKKRAKAKGFNFPYLYDESQAVAKAYRAACTPDFFLFDKSGKLYYRGQFDDSRPDNGIAVTGADLTGAVESMLGDKPAPESQTPSIGCNIKWKPGNEPDYFSA